MLSRPSILVPLFGPGVDKNNEYHKLGPTPNQNKYRTPEGDRKSYSRTKSAKI